MKHLLLTTIAVTSLLATTAFADPIHDAAGNGDLAGVQAELDKGVDVNAKDGWEWTPLHIAASKSHKEIIELLIAKGADVHAKSYRERTPLHDAAYRGHKEIVELLIDAGADVNAKNNSGETPLDLAIERKKTDTADLLRKHGGKTGEELALMPRLEYSKNQWPFTVSFTTAEGSTYVFQASGDLKNWSRVEEVNGTGGEVKVTDWREAIFQKQYYRVKLVE